jgi:protein-L-isoaspartate(D-aspartate) O-methyltransferase
LDDILRWRLRVGIASWLGMRYHAVWGQGTEAMKSSAVQLLLLLLTPALVWAQTSFRVQRSRMVEDQIEMRGITDERVLEAFRRVPREEFVPLEFRHLAYGDFALPIGFEQTISQPYIVAFMTQRLDLQPGHRLFELGTGSGYQAAIASQLVEEVYTVEIVPGLAARADSVLKRLGVDNVHVRCGDGWAGWPEAAPFDRIIVTAAAESLPRILLEQLRPGGRMILPLGPQESVQHLVLVHKQSDGGIVQQTLLPVRFVPVTGEHEDEPDPDKR